MTATYNYADQFDALELRTSEFIETIIDWAHINSGSQNHSGLASMAETLEAYCQRLGDSFALRDADDFESFAPDGSVTVRRHGQNIHIRRDGPADRRVVLTGHMDTVFPADSHFQKVEWLDDDLINGPGTADMKGGLLVMIEALRLFETSPSAKAIGWEVIINSDEEIGSLGSAALLAEAGGRCQIGLTFEPSTTPEGMLAGARKGSGNFALKVAGRSAHAGREPELGRNAVVAAADVALQLQALFGQKDGLTVNVARIDGGAANNVVPDNAVLHWNMRVPNPDVQSWAEQEIERIVEEASRAHEVSMSLKGGFYRPPKPMTPRGEKLFNLVKDVGSSLGLDLSWKDTGGVCDGNNLAAHDVAVVDTLGVRGGAIHSDQEFMIVSSIPERIKLATLTLERLANSGKEEGLFE